LRHVKRFARRLFFRDSTIFERNGGEVSIAGGQNLQAERVDALLRQLWTLEDMPKAATLIEMTKV
jgi:hypothetical protein